jgi:hypothetical protein
MPMMSGIGSRPEGDWMETPKGVLWRSMVGRVEGKCATIISGLDEMIVVEANPPETAQANQDRLAA